MEKGLTVENLFCERDGFQLQVSTFKVKPGEIVSVIGKSGSGKSTFLNALAGFVPCQGSILANGRDIQKSPPEKRELAYVFQKGALFPHLTVYENLEFPLKVKKINKEKRKLEVNKMLRRLEIFSLQDQYPQNISGGEGQRVAMGRALLTHFPFILLDEPFSSLDSELKKSMRILLKELVIEHQVGAILVTHDLEDSSFLSQRVYQIENGQLIEKV